MSHRNRRWAWAAVTAALFGTAARADEPSVVLPPPPDVTLLPAATVANRESTPVKQPVVSEVPKEEELVITVPDVPPPEPVPQLGHEVMLLTAETVGDQPPPMSLPPVELAPQLPLIPDPLPAPLGPPSGFYAGAGLLFLRPYVSNNTAYTLTTPAAGAFPIAVASARNVPFEWDCGQAVQIWAGWTHASGCGVRADGFLYDQGSEALTLRNAPAPWLVTVPAVIPFIPGAASFGTPTAVLAGAGIGADQLLFSSDLLIRSADVELTYQWAGDDFVIRLSGGGRVQSLRQEYHATLRNLGDGITTESQRLEFAQEFTGGGPTVGLFARHSIVGELSAYASVRGAILVGHVARQGAFFQDIHDPTLAAFVGSQQTKTRFDSRADHVLTYGELELGLEYGVTFGHSRFYVRGGVVAQSYGNAGSATVSTGTLSLIGGQAAVGLNY